MGKPTNQQGFQALLKEWNLKLKQSGFKDIEIELHGESILKQSGTVRRYHQLDPIIRDAKQIYYSRLSALVGSTHFRSDFERRILQLYSEGVSQANIYRQLKVKGHRCKVYYPLYKWLRKWGLKK